RRAGEALLREFQVARVGVESDKRAGGTEMPRDDACVTGAAEGAIDDRFPGGGGEVLDHFIEQHGVMASVGQIHSGSMPKSTSLGAGGSFVGHGSRLPVKWVGRGRRGGRGFHIIF